MSPSWRDVPSAERSFDGLPEVFDRFVELAGGPLDDYLTTVLPPEGGQRAVDLGCGTGRHAMLLAGRYQHVLAVDVSAPMLEFARRRRPSAAITYQQRDLREVRADTDGTFDLVLSTHALHHVDDLEQTLRGIRELVAPGGRVVLVDNVAPRPAVPRWWFVREAMRTLAVDLARRRPAGEAWELYRLSVDPAWLDHVTSDRFLSPTEFARHYGQVFPNATFTDLYRTRAMCWQAPAGNHRERPSSHAVARTDPRTATSIPLTRSTTTR